MIPASKLPSWMRQVDQVELIQPSEAYIDMLRSWMVLADHIGKLNRNECLHVMSLELTVRQKPRKDILHRLFVRYRKLGSDETWADVLELL